MPQRITGYRVFIASPGGLQTERQAFRDVLQECNAREALPDGATFIPVGWEETLPGNGRAQSLINEDLMTCDYFILLLWDRWGMPPSDGGKFTSGTEEEYELARKCLQEGSMKEIVLLFKGVSPSQLTDPGDQLKRVLAFRSRIEQEKTLLYKTFDKKEEFESILRAKLSQWMRDHRTGSAPTGSMPPAPPGAGEADAALPSPALQPGSGNEKRPRAAPVPAAAGPRGSPERDDILHRAGTLADEGRLTEAEVLYAQATVRGDDLEAMRRYAIFLLRVGRLDHALVLLMAVEKGAAEAGDFKEQADSYNTLGNIFLTRGDFNKAEEFYAKALALSETLDYRQGMAKAINNLGNIFHTRGDLEKAEESLRNALVINEKLGRQEGMAMAYGNLGVISRTRGDLDKAEEFHYKSLAIHEKIGNQEGMASAYGNLGNIFHTRGDLDRAEEYHRKALAIHEKIGNQEGMAGTFSNLGVIFRTRGNPEKAEEFYRKSLTMFEKIGSQEGVANTYTNLGNIFHARGDLKKAEEFDRRSLTIFEKIGHQEGTANAYSNLGTVFYTHGDLDKSEEFYSKSLAIFERIGRQEGAANAYGNLGNIFRARGDFDKAGEFYRKSFAIHEKVGNPSTIAQNALALAHLLVESGSLREARDLLERAVRLFEEAKDVQRGAMARDLLGWIEEQES